jgi:hypothetical protein
LCGYQLPALFVLVSATCSVCAGISCLLCLCWYQLPAVFVLVSAACSAYALEFCYAIFGSIGFLPLVVEQNEKFCNF